MVRPNDVLSFWIDEVGPSGWYAKDDALDQSIRDRFLDFWQYAATADCEGSKLEEWFSTPETVLALIIVMDQFSRNMFRDDARAFATDARARAVAKKAIDRKWDLRVAEPQRQFFYMPLMHSECLMDQDRAVRLFKTRMEGDLHLLHAKVHRKIIRDFGRFPFRNEALSRESSRPEAAFIENGGYGAVLRDFQAAQAARAA